MGTANAFKSKAHAQNGPATPRDGADPKSICRSSLVLVSFLTGIQRSQRRASWAMDPERKARDDQLRPAYGWKLRPR
jgi:hypothetical protein